jgi:hypothetical protein
MDDLAQNAQSTDAAAVMARQTLGIQSATLTPVESDDERQLKRRRLELELDRYAAETARITAEAAIMQRQAITDAAYKGQQTILGWIDASRQLAPDGQLEGRDRIIFQDAIRNALSHQFREAGVGSPPALTENGEVSSTAVHASHWLTISNQARRMNIHLNPKQLKRAGVLMSGYYRDRYGRAPDKHTQDFVGGKSLDVNSYTVDDIDLMERAIQRAASEVN